MVKFTAVALTVVAINAATTVAAPVESFQQIDAREPEPFFPLVGLAVKAAAKVGSTIAHAVHHKNKREEALEERDFENLDAREPGGSKTHTNVVVIGGGGRPRRSLAEIDAREPEPFFPLVGLAVKAAAKVGSTIAHAVHHKNKREEALEERDFEEIEAREPGKTKTHTNVVVIGGKRSFEEIDAREPEPFFPLVGLAVKAAAKVGSTIAHAVHHKNKREEALEERDFEDLDAREPSSFFPLAGVLSGPTSLHHKREESLEERDFEELEQRDFFSGLDELD